MLNRFIGVHHVQVRNLLLWSFLAHVIPIYSSNDPSLTGQIEFVLKTQFLLT